MTHRWISPTVGLVIHAACEVTGNSPERLLESSGREIRAACRAADRYPELPDGAAVFAARLIDVLPEGPRAVAAILNSHLDDRLIINALALAMGLRGWAESRHRSNRSLRDWLAQYIAEAPVVPPRSNAQWRAALRSEGADRLPIFERVGFGPPDGSLTLFVSGAFAHLLPGGAPQTQLWRNQIARGVDAALVRRGALSVRLVYPTIEAQDDQAASAVSWWRRSVDELQSEADGFLLIDVANRAPGFGSGFEVAAQEWPPRPRLQLVDSCAGHSLLEGAAAERLQFTVVSCETLAQAPAIVAAWVDRVLDDLVLVRRNRLDRRVLQSPGYAAFILSIRSAPPEILRDAMETAGIDLALMKRLIASIDSWIALPAGQRDDFMDVIRPKVRHRPLGSAPKPPKKPGRELPPALLEAQEKAGWTVKQTLWLYQVVQAERTQSGVRHRFSLNTADDWIAAYERLRPRP